MGVPTRVVGANAPEASKAKRTHVSLCRLVCTSGGLNRKTCSCEIKVYLDDSFLLSMSPLPPIFIPVLSLVFAALGLKLCWHVLFILCFFCWATHCKLSTFLCLTCHCGISVICCARWKVNRPKSFRFLSHTPFCFKKRKKNHGKSLQVEFDLSGRLSEGSANYPSRPITLLVQM